jgi:hypothetical protein
MLAHLQRLPVERLERFMDHRDAKKAGIPETLAKYIIEINDAYNLNKKYRSIGECAKQMRIKYPYLSLPTCKSRIYDAINFFNADCSVTASAWNNYYADRMEDLVDVLLVAHKFELVEKCWAKARQYRLEASANVIDPDRIRFKPQIVSADINLKRMGVSSPQGILTAWNEIEKIVGTQDISPTEKERLLDEARRELNIEDTEYEEADEG